MHERRERRHRGLFAVALGCGLTVLLTACATPTTGDELESAPASTVLGATPDGATTVADAVPATAVAPASGGDFGVSIVGAAYASDYEGKPVIVVSFAFTNNSDKAASFLFSLNAQAFQAGVELNDLAIGVEGVDSSLTMADIQPGVTLTVQEAFLLRDSSNVIVEVREQFSFSDDVLASSEFAVGA